MRVQLPPLSESDTMTTTETAKLLHCCPHTIRRLELRRILIPARPFGRRKLFFRRDVESLLLLSGRPVGMNGNRE